MGILKNLLGASGLGSGSANDLQEDLKGTTDALGDISTKLITTVQNVMRIVMPIVLAAVLALGVFFCIKLGIAYAKAEKTEDREEAKKRLVGAIIGFGIGIVGAAVMWILFTNYSILSALFG